MVLQNRKFNTLKVFIKLAESCYYLVTAINFK